MGVKIATRLYLILMAALVIGGLIKMIDAALSGDRNAVEFFVSLTLVILGFAWIIRTEFRKKAPGSNH